MKRAATIAFVLSGASSLVFQVIWSRMLQHVFGATSIAVATVLAVFMGGLGLGAFIAARTVDKLRQPLVAYAVAELGVGLAGLIIPALLTPDGWLSNINAARSHYGAESLTFYVLRFACIVPVLIVPTTLMGTTLPLLTRHFVTAERQLGGQTLARHVGHLYAANTMGAVLGAFVAGFVLMPTFGLRVTNLCAVGANLSLCVAVLAARRWLTAGSSEIHGEVTSAAVADDASHGESPWPRRLAFGAFAASGAAALAYEVLWTRAIVMTVGSSVQAFSLVLMTCLLGIAAGSAAAAASLAPQPAPDTALFAPAIPWRLRIYALLAVAGIAWFTLGGLVGGVLAAAIFECVLVLGMLREGRRRPMVLLAGMQFAIAGLAFVSSVFLPHLPSAFLELVHLVDEPADHVLLVRGFMFAVAFVVTFPGTFAMGAMFPVTMATAHGADRSRASEVGRAYAVNTVGAIAGAWLAGFALMPWFGLPRALLVVMGLNLGTGALVLAAATRMGVAGWTRWLLPSVPVVVAAAYLAAWVPGAPLRWRTEGEPVGAFRLSQPVVAAGDTLFRHDGVSTTVTVERNGTHLALRNNGKVDASNGGDMATQIAVPAYPLLLTPSGAAKGNVAIIGFGSGVSVGAALAFPADAVDVVELEPGVITASRYFARENHLTYGLPRYPYVTTPRVHIIHDDGRNYLASTAKRYDVIASEPSNPWIAGVADLFTKEHFRVAAHALTKDGIYAQWVQLYELSPRNVKSILRTFIGEFPHAMAFAAGPYSSDLILVGSRAPMPFSYDRLAALLGDPKRAALLAPAKLRTPSDLLARMVFTSREEMRAFADHHDVPINTDDNGSLEFSAPSDLIRSARFGNFSTRLYEATWPYGKVTAPMVDANGADGATRWADVVRALLSAGRGASATDALGHGRHLRGPAMDEASQLVALLTTDTLEPKPNFDVALTQLRTDAKTSLNRATLGVVQTAMSRQTWAVASVALDRLILEDHPRTPELRFLQGFLAHKAGLAEGGEAADILSSFADDDAAFAQAQPSVFYFLARALWAAADFDGAVTAMKRYLAVGDRR